MTGSPSVFFLHLRPNRVSDFIHSHVRLMVGFSYNVSVCVHFVVCVLYSHHVHLFVCVMCVFSGGGK